MVMHSGWFVWFARLLAVLAVVTMGLGALLEWLGPTHAVAAKSAKTAAAASTGSTEPPDTAPPGVEDAGSPGFKDTAPPAAPDAADSAPEDGDAAAELEPAPEDGEAIDLRKVGRGGDSSFTSRSVSLLGVAAFILLAWLLSTDRKRVNWRLVAIGTGLQLAFALLIFYVPGGRLLFDAATRGVRKLLDFTAQGSGFLFRSYVSEKWEPELINFAFSVLPTIIFFSALMTILYHAGVMQWVVHGFAWVMQKTMRTSGAESLSAAANIFVGQTEAPLVVKPYVEEMTHSELMTVMTGGFATVAGGVLAIYVGMLERMFPDIAGHLLAASVMSAPAALVVGKIMWPETSTPATSGKLALHIQKEDANVLDAASRGAAEGLRLALNVGAMLLAFLALIALLNAIIGLFLGIFMDQPWTLQQIFGALFAPVAWVMGVPWADCFEIGRLLGTKLVVNEMVGYAELQKMLQDPDVHLADRSVIIATYALCGFANFGSIGIQLGGIGGIAPGRKHELARIVGRALIAGTLAAFMTGTVAGVLI